MIELNSIVKLISKPQDGRGVIGEKYKVADITRTDIKLCSIETNDMCFYTEPKNVIEDIIISIPDWIKSSTFGTETFETKLDNTTNKIIKLLKSKNKAYGDTALNPVKIFSRLDATEAICARIDDKIMRIKNKGINDKTEDTVDDLIGYLLLLKMSM
jgi:hypothetical protein|tara:strand:- start:11594 stop:12064 length:471 start_codon:yes stop_codon:yes gene_type:complete